MMFFMIHNSSHTCEQKTGDTHDDPDNPQDGNPHNTEDDDNQRQ